MIEVNGVRIGVHENHFVMEFVTDEAKALYQSNKEYFRKGFEDICNIANADIKKALSQAIQSTDKA